jgi:hypothetical protein
MILKGTGPMQDKFAYMADHFDEGAIRGRFG